MSYLKKTFKKILFFAGAVFIFGYLSLGFLFGWHPITITTVSSVIIPEEASSFLIKGFSSLGFDVDAKSEVVAPICLSITGQSIANKKLFIFEDLLDLGADPNTTCNWKTAPNQFASKGIPLLWVAISDTIRPLSTVTKLINSGAKVNRSLQIRNKEVNTVQWAITSLTQNKNTVSDNEKKKIIDILIASGAELPDRLKSNTIPEQFLIDNQVVLEKILKSKIENTINTNKIIIMNNDYFI